jgi:3-dehydrosphinganine reductase
MFRRHVFITGGSLGLGRALAVEFATQGARVTIMARKLQALQEAKSVDETQIYDFGIILCIIIFISCNPLFTFCSWNASIRAERWFFREFILSACKGKSSPSQRLADGSDPDSVFVVSAGT